ncbi:MAG TPA: amidohydrolase family protein [Acidimicrobiales bacterium]|nr:amidohydrolase family protein [Acidimicrobiales bacterium]
MDIYPISTDDHAWEKPDTFTSRVPAKLRDECPHLEVADGEHWWVYAGRRVRKVGTGAAAMLPDRGAVRLFEEAPAAVYDAVARLETMDADGVAAEVLFPQASGFGGGPFVSTEGSVELRLASIRAYNDYLAEEWAGVSRRFVAQCLLPMWDVELAVAELRRAHELGHKAAVWTSAPQSHGFSHFNDRYWDPLWSTLSELDMPVALHIGSVKTSGEFWEGYSAFSRLAVVSVTAITSNVQAIANLLFSGVLERFPSLAFVSVESGLGWVPYLLETADHQYEAQHLWDEGMSMRPSEYFRRQVYVNFWFEHSGIELRHMIGVDNILWEADFPHPTSTYPHSRKAIETSLSGVPPEEQKKLLESNASRLFGIDLDPSTLPESVCYRV